MSILYLYISLYIFIYLYISLYIYIIYISTIYPTLPSYKPPCTED